MSHYIYISLFSYIYKVIHYFVLRSTFTNMGRLHNYNALQFSLQTRTIPVSVPCHDSYVGKQALELSKQLSQYNRQGFMQLFGNS